MFVLNGAVKRYPWGSTSAIPAILDAEPDGTPWAEYWLGAHPDGPATTIDGQALDTLIQHDPSILGGGSRATFGDRLPFLVKILSAAAPLSIQVHPSRAQARAGYAQENARGMAPDSPERSFRDDWPKPEILIAFDTFDALVGLREPAHTAHLLNSLHIPQIAPIVSILADTHPTADATREAFLAVLDQATSQMVAALAAAVDPPTPSAPQSHDFRETARILTSSYPGDPSVLAALMLNRVRLRPREAIFVPAGTLHAYLQGVGVEVMGASDNVVRGGLTSKHIDVPVLTQIGNFQPHTPPILRPHITTPGLHTYHADAPEFRVWLVRQPPAPIQLPAPDRARIMVGVSGQLTLQTGGQTATLGPGQALFVRAGETLTVSGPGTATLVCAGHEPDPITSVERGDRAS